MAEGSLSACRYCGGAAEIVKAKTGFKLVHMTKHLCPVRQETTHADKGALVGMWNHVEAKADKPAKDKAKVEKPAEEDKE